VRQRCDGFAAYTAYAHLASLDPALAVGAFWRAGRPIGVMGGSGAGQPNKYAKHTHWAMASLDNPGFARDYARLYDPLAFLEEEDVTLSEDLLLGTYSTRDELLALTAGTLDRDTALANARGRLKAATVIDEAWEQGGLYFQIGDHLDRPRHGGAAPLVHTH
jgi:hypothetical protein